MVVDSTPSVPGNVLSFAVDFCFTLSSFTHAAHSRSQRAKRKGLCFVNEDSDCGMDSGKVYGNPSLRKAMRKRKMETSVETDCVFIAPAASANVAVSAKESQPSFPVVETTSTMNAKS